MRGIETLVFLIPLALAVVLTYVLHRGRNITTDSFFVARREQKTVVIALSIASSWIWTVALFVIPQKVYELGAVAMIAFVGVNAGALLLLAFLVPRVRAYGGNVQLTLPQFVEMRDSKKTGAVFTTGVLGVQIYSVITHMLGAALILKVMTSGANKEMFILLLAIAFLIVAALRGLESSIIADIIKYSAVFGIVMLAFFATEKAGGVDALMGGLTGLRPEESGLVPIKTLWLFVIPVSAALLSAVAMDDQLYQRGFAAKNNPKRAFVLATAFFVIIPIGMSMLGLLAANKALAVGVTDLQLTGFQTIQKLVPGISLYVLAAAVMTALIGSGGSALHAAGNVGAKNVAQMFWPQMSDASLVWASRATMVITLVVGTVTALAGVGIFELWIGWGMFRAVLFFPLIALIITNREYIPSVFSWIAIGLPTTLASFALFKWLGEPTGVASGEAILVAWGTTLALWVWHAYRSKRSLTIAV